MATRTARCTIIGISILGQMTRDWDGVC
jgi:hypothetical protein